MINTREELFNSTAAAVTISKELQEELGVSSSVITREQIDNLKLINESLCGVPKIKGKGGRPRLPEPSNPDGLEGKELLKYKNRQWQRQSRARRGIGNV